MTETSSELHAKYEPRPDAQELTGNKSDSDTPRNVNTDVDYEPHPEKSLKVSPEHEAIIKSITSLYSGSCSEADMEAYAEKAIYDDPLSYSDSRYKIAGMVPQLASPKVQRRKGTVLIISGHIGQWWGLPKVSLTLRVI